MHLLPGVLHSITPNLWSPRGEEGRRTWRLAYPSSTTGRQEPEQAPDGRARDPVLAGGVDTVLAADVESEAPTDFPVPEESVPLRDDYTLATTDVSATLSTGGSIQIAPSLLSAAPHHSDATAGVPMPRGGLPASAGEDSTTAATHSRGRATTPTSYVYPDMGSMIVKLQQDDILDITIEGRPIETDRTMGGRKR